MSDLPFSACDLPASSFPFTLEYLRGDTHEVIRKDVVEGPGVVSVPPLGKLYGVPVGVRVTYADGSTEETWPS